MFAKVETSSKVTVDTENIQWFDPYGGNVVYDYVTNASEGYVVTLEEEYHKWQGYYYTEQIEFCYTSNNPGNKLGSLTATLNLETDTKNPQGFLFPCSGGKMTAT